MVSDRILSLPGRGNTYFYFTKMGPEGFSGDQISYIESIIRSYRERFSLLEITGVWDFGMEEGAKYSGEKYGDFAACKDNAVFNIKMMSISYNHIRVSKMPANIPDEELQKILRRYDVVKELSLMAAGLREKLMNSGTHPREIELEVDRAARLILEREGFPFSNSEDTSSGESAKTDPVCSGAAVKERTSFSERNGLCFDPGPHNHLPLEDPLFADVWAIRKLEETMSIRRLTVHELGHAISHYYGILGLKAVKKLFAKCREGFEDLDEFCAECFMASEITDRIPLANSLSALIEEQRTGAKLYRKSPAIQSVHNSKRRNH